MFRHLLRSLVSRSLAVVLVAGQVLTAVPILASPAPTTATTPALPPPSPAPEPPRVTVNRNVPTVTAPPSEPQFSASPTVREIFRARVFKEPIVPVGGVPTAGENLVLARALLALHRSGGRDWRSTVGEFLSTHAESPWRASLLANIGTLQLRERGYSRALDAWSQAWVLAKDATDSNGRAVADFALAEWLTLAASFGQIEQVEQRLADMGNRSVSGSAGPKINAARETISLIKRHPERTLPCGPAALLALLVERAAVQPEFLTRYHPTSAGTSLAELERLAERAGLSVIMAFRDSATEIPLPAIVHLKVGHYIALAERQGDRYRVVDRVRAVSYWINRETLFDESSGYVLVPSNQLAAGWRRVTEDEAAAIKGRGPVCPDGSEPPAPPEPDDDEDPDTCEGMPVYRFQGVTASLLLKDIPAGYTPPRGPAVSLGVSYHQREWLQAQLFTSSNMGPKWTFNARPSRSTMHRRRGATMR